MPRLTQRFAILTALALAWPAVGRAEGPIDPYPPPLAPPPVLPVAPPPRVPPVLPIAPPHPVPPVLLVAPPPPPPGAVLPIAPPPRLLPGPPPSPISPVPHLVPSPTPAWEEPGCPLDCAEQQLTYAPPPVRTERVPRYGLMAGGLIIFGVTWTTSALTGLVSDEHQLFVPVVGPIFAAVDIGRTNDSSPGRDQRIATLAFDSIAQTAGLVMAIVGASTKVTVRKRPIHIVPTGVGVYGRF